RVSPTPEYIHANRNYKRADPKCDRPRARDDSRAARDAAPRESLERENELPVRLTHRRDRQTIARAQQLHPREILAGMRAQLFQRDGAREAALQLHVHHEPAGIGAVAVGVVVVVLAIEGGGVGVTLLHDAHDGDDARPFGARMVEKGLVTAAHLVAQQVARLEIAHRVPRGAPGGGGGEMLDAEGAGLGLHQPVLHRMIPSSVTTASSSTSCGAGAMRSTCWKA